MLKLNQAIIWTDVYYNIFDPLVLWSKIWACVQMILVIDKAYCLKVSRLDELKTKCLIRAFRYICGVFSLYVYGSLWGVIGVNISGNFYIKRNKVNFLTHSLMLVCDTNIRYLTYIEYCRLFCENIFWVIYSKSSQHCDCWCHTTAWW